MVGGCWPWRRHLRRALGHRLTASMGGETLESRAGLACGEASNVSRFHMA
jgi:hypothetical protein